MTMSLHKLTAGTGYTYLTRQVAAQDRTGGARTPLASYYTERGETPGHWVGSGMTGIDGLNVGDEVTAAQMQALFGAGLHPLAQQRRERLEGPDLSEVDFTAVTRLGVPFKVFRSDVTAFQVEVAQRIQDHAASLGHPRDYPISAGERARIRTQVAIEFFRAEHHRDPADARELSGTIATLSRPRTTAVAGYDLTFSPVKSVSALWAIAPPHIAAQVELAHHEAVADALAFLEAHAVFTREGTNGVRQVDVTGLVAASFTHRDSRAGDPDLHTHVAVANKVQTRSGKWLSIDGRVLFKANVTASETYNTAQEKHLRARLGLVFAERAGTDRGKRSVRELVGVDPALNARWSTRRVSIEARRAQLATAFQADHGRPPSVVESIQLAQQATLETRDVKHEPRTLAEQRQAWRAQAEEVLGGPVGVSSMLARALTAEPAAPSPVVDAAWVTAAAGRVLDAVQAHRSTWQVWHVRAEASRQVRAVNLPAEHVETVVDLVTDHTLTTNCVRLTGAGDGIAEPKQLRRADGTSVYEVAGSAVFTSATIMAAESRLVQAAGVTDRHRASPDAVTLALLEQAANGTTLNSGQSALVTGMATSGARVQLAIAPAGAGKTTAMRALAAAWTEDGGTVLGLAPSAAAAAVLREQIGATTDTLAKLTWSLTDGDLPDWADAVGPRTLVVIDEAGMADTLTLDTVVLFVTARGGQVRLIGDTQQLAAIGAGGVLRDIATTCGALHLSELMRFADPAEAAASLALRDGLPEALGFYLDHGRVHVGDQATLVEQVFTAWSGDRARGVDAIMLAPTRDLVGELNQRAQQHRLTPQGGPGGPAGRGAGVKLADGSSGYVGDTILTRANDRRLRLGAHDWVKNGDRWTIQQISPTGAVTARHTRTGHRTTLPPAYVRECTELGYATTIHGAQGISAATMHGLATGTESRQQLYTMLTRGAHGNHLYLQVVGDGDPHGIIHPDNVHPRTATDLLEAILARDATPASATTTARAAASPTTQLGAATARYLDALHAAAEHHLGPAALTALDKDADRAVPGITDDPAWPALRAHLVLLAAAGTDPLTGLRNAADRQELDTARDRAAVLGWRLDDTGLRNAGTGPLPWLPGIPAALRQDPHWGEYLTRRAALVTTLTAQVRDQAHAAQGAPSWWRSTQSAPVGDLLADLTIWRAATGVPDGDARPTGPAQPAKAHALWQRSLQHRLRGADTPAMAAWTQTLLTLVPAARGDAFTPQLTERLTAIARTGIDTHTLLTTATGAALPDDHAASALWWRISRHLAPAVAQSVEHALPLTPAWAGHLADAVGRQRAAALKAGQWWPALVAVIDHALARGEALDSLLAMTTAPAAAADDVDQCQSLVWRISLLTQPPPLQIEPPPEECDDDLEWLPPTTTGVHPAPGAATHRTAWTIAAEDVDAVLGLEALARAGMGPLEPTDAHIESMVANAAAWDHEPFTPHRAAHVNDLAADYYARMLDAGWAGTYLRDRLRSSDTPPGAGYAPPGWTHLTRHLRRHGVTDAEMLAAGLGSRARTGAVVDRFRDRLVLPITVDGTVVGFVARRHPDTDATHGPKYLNTPTTAAFHKGEILYGVDQQLLRGGATPVLVEGPLDALAVTTASHGRYLGVAPLGTTLTQSQARLLATLHPEPVVATDADPAGRAAAERAYWLLTQHATTPRAATLPDGSDPADLLHHHGADALTAAIDNAHPLAEDLIRRRLTDGLDDATIRDVATVIAADDPSRWLAQARHVADRTGTQSSQVLAHLAEAATRWNHDPGPAAERQVGATPGRGRQRPSISQVPNDTAAGDVRDQTVPSAKAADLEPAHRPRHPEPTPTSRPPWPTHSPAARPSIGR
jgi:DNA primase catalytic core